MMTKDEQIRHLLHEFAQAHPRWGWRKAYWHLRNEGFYVNHKKIQRLWRQEGLRVPQKRRNKCKRGKNIKATASRANEIWAVDFQMDQTTDGK